MVPWGWIALLIIGLLLGFLFAYLFFNSENAHAIAAREQIQSLRRCVQEKNAEIELLYARIRKTAQEGTNYRKDRISPKTS
jgi:hypothetical protein